MHLYLDILWGDADDCTSINEVVSATQHNQDDIHNLVYGDFQYGSVVLHVNHVWLLQPSDNDLLYSIYHGLITAICGFYILNVKVKHPKLDMSIFNSRFNTLSPHEITVSLAPDIQLSIKDNVDAFMMTVTSYDSTRKVGINKKSAFYEQLLSRLIYLSTKISNLVYGSHDLIDIELLNNVYRVYQKYGKDY